MYLQREQENKEHSGRSFELPDEAGGRICRLLRIKCINLLEYCCHGAAPLMKGSRDVAAQRSCKFTVFSSLCNYLGVETHYFPDLEP